MGKKRTANVEGEAKKAKKEMFRWEEAYNDLPIHIASSLREARVKPEQLRTMPDGEVLAIDGVHPNDLETVRSKYPTDLAPIEEKVESKKEEVQEEKKAVSTHPRTKTPRFTTGRSSVYKGKKTKVENKNYSLEDSVKKLREISYSKHKTVELHINTKEAGLRGEISIPHSSGKQIRVAIFSPEVETAIKAEKIDFDILLATPADMGKIAPLARFLGPKGLMPNPRNNTITDNPKERAEKLQAGGTLSYKTEAKTPIIHLTVGSLNQEDKQIQENIRATLLGIGVQKMNSAFLKSTMSPAVRLDLNSI